MKTIKYFKCFDGNKYFETRASASCRMVKDSAVFCKKIIPEQFAEGR
jgi:hypothetical protein